MSDAVEIVKRLSAAYASGGVAATAPFLHEDLRFFPGRQSGEPIVRGRDGYLAHHDRLASDAVELEVVQDRFEDLGEGRVLISGALRVRTPEGVDERPMHWLMTVAGEQVTSIAAHFARDEALRSLGRFA